MQSLPTLGSLRVSGKRVIIRVDFNVPIEHGVIQDDYRIERTLPTFRYLLKNGASVIILSHCGRPEGVYQKQFSLRPVALRLSKLLKRKIIFVENLDDAFFLSKTLRKGDILMVENIRFFKGEMENAPAFTKHLASLGDLYVNDAFADAHRAHASIVGIPKYLPHAAGLLLAKEVLMLTKFLKHPKRPYAAIVGGAKIATKLPLLKYFLKEADTIMVGGGIANTILAGKHLKVGKSITNGGLDISWLSVTNTKFHLPVDARVTKNLNTSKGSAIRAIGDVRSDEYIADVGPDTITLYQAIIKKAKTIVWNGPLGYIETPAYAYATKMLLKSVAASHAHTILGGGDLHLMIRKLGLEKKINHISTGGGAMLEFLAKKTLPGVRALEK